jgi:hypothetical protein
MKKQPLVAVVLAVCAVLLIAGFVFSVHLTLGISQAAHVEATQQSPVPTPASMATTKQTAAAHS